MRFEQLTVAERLVLETVRDTSPTSYQLQLGMPRDSRFPPVVSVRVVLDTLVSRGLVKEDIRRMAITPDGVRALETQDV